MAKSHMFPDLKSQDEINSEESVTKLHYYLNTMMWFAIIVTFGAILIFFPIVFGIIMLIIHYKGSGNKGNPESESGMF